MSKYYLCINLKNPKTEKDEICYLVEFHDTPITSKDISEDMDLAYKRYLVQYCDIYAHNPDKLESRIKYLNKVKKEFKISEC